jgi:hypothetical protein
LAPKAEKSTAMRVTSATLSDLSDGLEFERSGSGESDGSAWQLDTQMSIFSEEGDHEEENSKSLNATERWRKNTQMVILNYTLVNIYIKASPSTAWLPKSMSKSTSRNL